MKYGNVFYAEVTREIWEYDISDRAKLLFWWLNELEQRFTGEETDWFFRSDEMLASDLGWSLKTLKKAKRELKETDLIEVGKMHWVNPETGRKSTEWITSYRILK